MNLPHPTGLPSTVTVPDDVLWQQVEERVVLLDVNAGQYHALNDVGSRMWTLLLDSADVATAYASLRAIYDVDDDRLRSDLAAFIAVLVETDLLAAA